MYDYTNAVCTFVRNNYEHFYDLTLAAAISYDNASAELWQTRTLREFDPVAFDSIVAEQLQIILACDDRTEYDVQSM